MKQVEYYLHNGACRQKRQDENIGLCINKMALTRHPPRKKHIEQPLIDCLEHVIKGNHAGDHISFYQEIRIDQK